MFMVQAEHPCHGHACFFPVEDGTQYDNCNNWYRNVLTGLTPAAYKK